MASRRVSARLRRAFAVLVLASAAASCSDGEPASPVWPIPVAAPSPASCSGPGTCPATPPSWSGQVESIVDTGCNPCHAIGGAGQSLFDDTSYRTVHGAASSILTFVGVYCEMPPPDASALTSDERSALLSWVACGSPDN